MVKLLKLLQKVEWTRKKIDMTKICGGNGAFDSQNCGEGAETSRVRGPYKTENDQMKF